MFSKITKKFFESKLNISLYLNLQNISIEDVKKIKSFINDVNYDTKKDYINLRIQNNKEKSIEISINEINEINKVLDKIN